MNLIWILRSIPFRSISTLQTSWYKYIWCSSPPYWICHLFFSTHSFPGRFGRKTTSAKTQKNSACVILFENLSPVGKKFSFEKLPGPGWGFQHVPPRVQVPQASRGDFWDHILRVWLFFFWNAVLCVCLIAFNWIEVAEKLLSPFGMSLMCDLWIVFHAILLWNPEILLMLTRVESWCDLCICV